MSAFALSTATAHACTSGSCAHAARGSICACQCGGSHAHGSVTEAVVEVGRVKAAARFARDGGVFASLALAGGLAQDDEW